MCVCVCVCIHTQTHVNIQREKETMGEREKQRQKFFVVLWVIQPCQCIDFIFLLVQIPNDIQFQI